MEKVILLYKQRDYHGAIRILKKKYLRGEICPELCLFLFLSYKKIKKRKNALFWLRLGFYQYPEELRLAEALAYYVLLWKKDFQEALEPLSRLAHLTSREPFTEYLLSRYYFKRQDPEKAMLFAKAALVHGREKMFRKWYLYLLFHYKMNYMLEKYQRHYFVRGLTGKYQAVDQNLVEGNFQKFLFYKNTGIVLIDSFILAYPPFLYQLWKDWGCFLPDWSLLSSAEIFRDQGKPLLTRFISKKKPKKARLIDENLIKIMALLALLASLLYLFRGVF